MRKGKVFFFGGFMEDETNEGSRGNVKAKKRMKGVSGASNNNLIKRQIKLKPEMRKCHTTYRTLSPTFSLMSSHAKHVLCVICILYHTH